MLFTKRLFSISFIVCFILLLPNRAFALPLYNNYQHELVFEKGAEIGGVYIRWKTYPESGWSLYLEQNGILKEYSKHNSGYINEYVSLPAGHKKIVIASESKLSYSSIDTVPVGEVLSDIQKWEPPVEKADILIFSAHPDDELVFFGGTIPYYGGHLGKNVQVVYMTNPSLTRNRELLNGLWHCGIKNYPILGSFRDKLSHSIDEALKYWKQGEVTAFIVEQIRRFRPSVIITHDFNGEYGHGQHMLTAKLVTDSLSMAADSTKYPSSYEKYGVWDTPKCYIHLYKQNRIVMDWKQPLDSFDGKTAYQIACEAYDMHVSQSVWDFKVYDSGRYSSCEYGLYRSLVGDDILKNDFLENILPEPTPTPEPTPEPTPTPISTPKSTPAMEPVNSPQPSGGMPNYTLLFILLGIAVILFLILIALIICNRKKR